MSDRERDPFEVIGRVPKGRAYQWVAEKVYGTPASPRLYDLMVAAGWKPVPAKRHPNMPRRDRRVVYGGQVLMENSAFNAEVARSAEIAAARQMLEEHPGSGGSRPFVTDGVWRQFEPVSGSIPHADGEPRDVDVTITVRLAPNLVEAAAVCALTPEEYARRMVELVKRGDLDGVLATTLDRKAFEVRDLRLKER